MATGCPRSSVADEQNDVRVDLERWQQLALDVLLAEGVRGLAELAVLFVNEREMTELNDSYMGKPGPDRCVGVSRSTPPRPRWSSTASRRVVAPTALRPIRPTCRCCSATW